MRTSRHRDPIVVRRNTGIRLGRKIILFFLLISCFQGAHEAGPVYLRWEECTGKYTDFSRFVKAELGTFEGKLSRRAGEGKYASIGLEVINTCMSQGIVPNLWFDGNAKEAVDFYLEVFKDGKKLSTMYYPKTKEEGLADFQLELAGKELVIEFELRGLRFVAINADSTFKFNESVSFAVQCEDQAEIDYFWEQLSSVPESEQCGWCKDRFGVSWQVVPKNVEELMQRPGAFAHMMEMKKLIIDEY
jgi:predicted 3-demethylubiquinone-9 3-methyltransferase (glyoxalase superfamily)